MPNGSHRRRKASIQSAKPRFEPLEDRRLLANWSGDIPDGTVWTRDELQQIVGDVRVPPGATLTIQPGTLVKVNTGGSFALSVEGRLLAPGTKDRPILITSLSDDTGRDHILGNDDDADSNRDGSSTGAPGHWGGIVVQASSTGSILDHVDVRYAGGAGSPAIFVDGGELTLRNSTVRDSQAHGVRIQSSNPVLSGVAFVNNALDALSMDLASNPTVTEVVFANNRINGLAVDSGELPADSRWDDPDVVYHLSDGVTIPPGRTLTVAAGQVVKPGGFGPRLTVAGRLLVEGTAALPVLFTSPADDSAGGDTTNNGNTPAAPGDWGGITLLDTSTGSVIRHADIRYGGGTGNETLFVDGGELTLRDSTIRDSRANGLDARNRAVTISGSTFRNNGLRGLLLHHSDATLSSNTFSDNATIGLRIENSNPLVTGNRFQNNLGAALSMDLASNPKITAVELVNNGVNGLLVDSGTLAGDATWDDPDIVYVLNSGFNTYTVPEGATLTVAAGQILKGGVAGLAVAGRLLVNGTTERPVIFTAPSDDTAGGDTNNDGPLTSGPDNSWSGLEFTPTSAGSVVDHAEFRFGRGARNELGLIFVDSAAVTVRNSLVRSGTTNGILTNGNANVRVENSLLLDHVRGDTGIASGIAVNGGTVVAINNTIDGNDRGVRVIEGSATLINNLITFNRRVGVIVEPNGTLDARFNDVFNPGAVLGNYDGVADATGVNGNISADPKYFHRANSQYHLRAGSPAIDAATGGNAPAADFLGNPRIDDPHVVNRGGGATPFVDMGALERQEQSPLTGIDLATVDVDGPAAGMQDDVAIVQWTARNVGTSPATGSWQDAVYLSVDPIGTPDDILLGHVAHTGDVAPGQTYTGTAAVTLPGVLPGDYYFIVRANASQEVFEGPALANNSLAAADSIHMDLPELILGAAANGQLPITGAAKFYRVTVPAGSDLGVQLSGQPGAVNELYLKFGDVPSRQSFDARGNQRGAADQAASVGSTRAGTYYVMVFGSHLPSPESFTLTASLSDFAVTGVGPARASNTGQVTLAIDGARFSSTSRPRLIDSAGGVIEPVQVYYGNSRRIHATFDLTGRPLGPTEVRMTDISGASASLRDGFEIIAGQPGRLATSVTAPDQVRNSWRFKIEVEYANVGDADILAPVMRLRGQHGTRLSLNPSLSEQAVAVDLIGANPTGPAGVLPPGARGRITVYATANFLGSETFDLTIAEYPAVPMDWSAIGEETRPDGITDHEWDVLRASLEADMGDTWDDYHAAIAEAATLLPPAGGSRFVLRDVFRVLLDRARADVGISVRGQVQRADTAEPLGNLEVKLYNSDAREYFSTISLQDGSFLIPGVAPGTYGVTFSGFVSANGSPPITVNGTDVHGVNLLVTPGGEISGGVVAAAGPGIPLRGASVTARAADAAPFVAITDDNGEFHFDSLPAGVYEIETQRGTITRAAVDNISLAAGGIRRHVALVVETGGKVRGHVAAPSGPAVGALVSATTADGEVVATTTSATGDFEIEGLPAGLYDIAVSMAGFRRAVVPAVNVTAGQTTAGMDVLLQSAARLTGTVRSTDGSPAPSVLVVIRGPSGDVFTDLSNEAGDYLLDSLPGGDYTVITNSDRFMSAQAQVQLTANTEVNLDLTVAARGRVTGKVTSQATTAPLRGLTVSVVDAKGIVASTVTDSQGAYQLDELDRGAYQVVVGDPGNPGVGRKQVDIGASQPNATADFALDVAGIVSGAVFASDGVTPIAGARVVLSESAKPILVTATDSSGRYSLVILAAGTYQLETTADGQVFAAIAGVAVANGSESTDLDFVAGSEVIRGIVRDAVSAQPIPGATVLIARADAELLVTGVAQLLTDSSGSFRFSNAVPGLYRVTAHAEGHAFSAQTTTVHRGAEASLTLDLDGESLLRGVVRSVTSGDVLAGATLMLFATAPDPAHFVAYTDALGRYEFSRLAHGTYTLVVSSADHETSVRKGVRMDAATRDLNVTLAGAHTRVNGLVTHVLGPADHVEVTAVDTDGLTVARTRVNTDGSFAIDTLAPGNYMFFASAGGHRNSPSQSVTVNANQTVSLADFHLTPVAVSDPEGAEQEGESSTIGNERLRRFYEARTRQGDLRLSQLEATFAACSRDKCEGDYLLTQGWLGFARDAQNEMDSLTRNALSLEEFSKFGEEFAALTESLDRELSGVELRVRGTTSVFGDESFSSAIRLSRNLLADGEFEDAALLLSGLRVNLAQFGFLLRALTGVSGILGPGGGGAGRSRTICDVLAGIGEQQSGICTIGKEDITVQFNRRHLSSPPIDSFRDLQEYASRMNESIFIYNRNLGFFTEQLLEIVAFEKAQAKRDKYLLQAQQELDALLNCQRPPPPPLLITPGLDSAFGGAPDKGGGGGGGGGGRGGASSAPGSRSGGSTTTSVVAAFDPNDKIGPTGFGSRGFIQPGTIPYEVHFENDPDLGATAAAQIVVVTDLLDADLDLSTLEFTEFGFGAFRFEVPPGLSHYSTALDLRPDGIELIVPVVLDVDLNTRVLSVRFDSLDPHTLLAPDGAQDGFLRVNDKNRHNGEGFFAYRVRPRAELPTATEITNQASIVFDTNAPILTPATRHTLDAGRPGSSVRPLPERSGTAMVVTWSGSDDAGGSGIATYDVFVSIDGGRFELWQDDTDATSDSYTGQVGHTYGFFSVATDNVGHVETKAAIAESETLVVVFSWHNSARPMDINFDGFITPVGDVLPAVNELNLRRLIDSTGRLPAPPQSAPPEHAYDVNGDGFLSPVGDVLPIVNHLNAIGGEGERPPAASPAQGPQTLAAAMATELHTMRMPRSTTVRTIREASSESAAAADHYFATAHGADAPAAWPSIRPRARDGADDSRLDQHDLLDEIARAATGRSW